jgi:hypothetical protein
MITYITFNVSEIDSIDFNQVLETSVETLRYSVDKTQTVVKWVGEVPSCILSLTTKSAYMTYDEILSLLNSPVWTSNEPIQLINF